MGDVLAEFKSHLDACRSQHPHADIVACAGVQACEAVVTAGFELYGELKGEGEFAMPNSQTFFRLYGVTFMQDGTTPGDEIHFREARTGKLLGSFTVTDWPDTIPG